ncbi:MAG: hypothetical protein ABIP75_06995 [Pyrinomonadaceae bacterium]
MTKTVCLIMILTLWFCGCKANRWYGSFTGKINERSTVRRSPRVVNETAHGQPFSQTAEDEPLLEREGKVSFLTFRKCRLRLELDDATHAHVSDGQTCTITASGETMQMAMKGTAVFESSDLFTAEITGTPTAAGVEGEFVWKFTGTRKP